MIQFFPVLDEPLPNDMELVSQSGGIDLRFAMASGTVPGDLEGTENSSNGIESPAAILGRPDDIFAVHRASSALDAAAAAAAASSAGSPGEAPSE